MQYFLNLPLFAQWWKCFIRLQKNSICENSEFSLRLMYVFCCIVIFLNLFRTSIKEHCMLFLTLNNDLYLPFGFALILLYCFLNLSRFAPYWKRTLCVCKNYDFAKKFDFFLQIMYAFYYTFIFLSLFGNSLKSMACFF